MTGGCQGTSVEPLGVIGGASRELFGDGGKFRTRDSRALVTRWAKIFNPLEIESLQHQGEIS